MSKTLVILNPISGVGAADRLYAEIEGALRAGGLDFEHARTTSPRDATNIAEQAKRKGYDTIIAVGGDGSVHEVVNGMLRASNGEPVGTLGVIPVGSGNDFAKMFPLDADWREAVRRVLAHNTRWFDMGRVVGDHPVPGAASGARYFANALDAGFGALVAMSAHQIPLLRGTAMYLAAVFKTLAKFSNPRFRIRIADGSVIEQPSTMVVVSNGRCFGGGFWIAPDAEADDGLFDVIIADGLGRLGILSLLPKVMQGKHLGDPRVRFLRTSSLLIESPDALAVETDGEIPYLQAHRLEIDLLPKRLRVIV